MTLSEYLNKRATTISDFARRSKLHRTTIHRLLSGKQKPSAVTIAHIAKHTAGQVVETDWQNGKVGAQ